MIVDAHHHVWDPATADHSWMTGPHAPLRRRFDLADLEPLLRARGVDATIAVQTRSSLDETRELLSLPAPVQGVVGWVDLTDPGVADMLAGFAGTKLVGIRHQVHDEADPGWLARPDVRRGLRAVADAGLVYDLLVRPRELAAAVDAARQLPNLVFVVDHIAKPRIIDGADPEWEATMPRLATLPNVRVKLSGMVTEADWTGWTVAQLRPFVERTIEWAGTEAVMFGSDWPVCTLAAGYTDVFDALAEIVDGVDPGIFGATAARTYGLAWRP